MNETREQRLRRLRHRAHYTGMRETDLVLGTFAKRHLAAMDDAGLDAFEALLEYGDTAIRDWACGKAAIPSRFADTAMGDLLARLQAHADGHAGGRADAKD